MVLGKIINTKNIFLMQQLSSESVPEISLPPCITVSYWPDDDITCQQWMQEGRRDRYLYSEVYYGILLTR
jgi:hypothetical protein